MERRGKRWGGRGDCTVWGGKGTLEEGKKRQTGKGGETNVRAVLHEIKRYLQNTPACDALWRALLEVSPSLFLFVCGEGRHETV